MQDYSNEQRASALLEAAYNDYADAIFRHCYFRLLHREIAKELMQETFLKCFQYLKGKTSIDNMKAFLYKVANNVIVDHIRKKKEVSLDALSDEGFDPAGLGEVDVRRMVEERSIVEKIGKLEEDDRQLIILRYIDEWKPQDIADMLGLSPNVVSVRIHRALQKLKVILRNPLT